MTTMPRSGGPVSEAPNIVLVLAGNLGWGELRQRYEEVGYAVATSSPAALTDKVRGEELRWKKLIDDRGLKVE